MNMLLFIGFWILLAVVFALLNSIFGKDILDMYDFDEDLKVYQKRLNVMKDNND